MTDNSFFDTLNSITTNKKYWLDDPEKVRKYSPVGINIGLSQHIDSILFVNDMNQYWQAVSPQMHYDYLFNTIRQMKRPFRKWAKKTNDENIQMLQETFRINRQRAFEYLSLMSEKDLVDLRKDREIGG